MGKVMGYFCDICGRISQSRYKPKDIVTKVYLDKKINFYHVFNWERLEICDECLDKIKYTTNLEQVDGLYQFCEEGKR
jgi:hypothetical protein